VPVALAVYTASWAGWLATSKGYGRDWAAAHPDDGVRWLPAPLRALVAYHQQAYGFHTTLTSEHSYQSNPALWLFQQRPTSFFYEDQPTCGVTACSQAVTALGNPLIWWLGVAALAVVLYNAVVWADRRCWAILMGYVGGYLPWLFYAERTIFTFYTVAFLPFVVLALAYAAGRLIGPAPHPPPVGGSGGEPAGRARLTVAPLAPAEAGGGGAAATAGLTADSGEAGNQDGGDGADSRSLADQLFAALANGSRPTGDGPDRGAPGDGATNASDGDSLAPFRVIVEPETAAVDPDPVPEGQRGIVVAVAVAVGLILLVSAFFWPIWSGQSVPYDFWRMHMWLPTWV
ncbi:MAG: hypothetical protein LBO20_02410, partial [Bifidobacteriaceae bacterium]|jgi:hypothetical protein|nr:hypothetical protein [Bifidobacteriaceae bacterium]